MEMCLDLTGIAVSRSWFLCSLRARSVVFGKLNGLGWVADKNEGKDFRDKQNLVTTVVQVYF